MIESRLSLKILTVLGLTTAFLFVLSRNGVTAPQGSAAGSAAAATNEWLTWGFDQERTLWNRAETLIGKDNVGQLALKWKTLLPTSRERGGARHSDDAAGCNREPSAGAGDARVRGGKRQYRLRRRRRDRCHQLATSLSEHDDPQGLARLSMSQHAERDAGHRQGGGSHLRLDERRKAAWPRSRQGRRSHAGDRLHGSLCPQLEPESDRRRHLLADGARVSRHPQSLDRDGFEGSGAAAKRVLRQPRWPLRCLGSRRHRQGTEVHLRPDCGWSLRPWRRTIRQLGARAHLQGSAPCGLVHAQRTGRT